MNRLVSQFGSCSHGEAVSLRFSIWPHFPLRLRAGAPSEIGSQRLHGKELSTAPVVRLYVRRSHKADYGGGSTFERIEG